MLNMSISGLWNNSKCLQSYTNSVFFLSFVKKKIYKLEQKSLNTYVVLAMAIKSLIQLSKMNKIHFIICIIMVIMFDNLKKKNKLR